MRKFIKKSFKVYSYILGTITPLLLINYMVYKRKLKPDDVDSPNDLEMMVYKGLQQILIPDDVDNPEDVDIMFDKRLEKLLKILKQ